MEQRYHLIESRDGLGFVATGGALEQEVLRRGLVHPRGYVEAEELSSMLAGSVEVAAGAGELELGRDLPVSLLRLVWRRRPIHGEPHDRHELGQGCLVVRRAAQDSKRHDVHARVVVPRIISEPRLVRFDGPVQSGPRVVGATGRLLGIVAPLVDAAEDTEGLAGPFGSLELLERPDRALPQFAGFVAPPSLDAASASRFSARPSCSMATGAAASSGGRRS